MEEQAFVVISKERLDILANGHLVEGHDDVHVLRGLAHEQTLVQFHEAESGLVVDSLFFRCIFAQSCDVVVVIYAVNIDWSLWTLVF